MMIEDWTKYIVNIDGYAFRPVSMGSLTLLYQIGSPLVFGGDITPTDFAIFAWLHGERLQLVISHIKAKTYEEAAIRWACELPASIFSLYTQPTIKALARDIESIFVDKETGFIPFPCPSVCKTSCWLRVIRFMKRLFRIG